MLLIVNDLKILNEFRYVARHIKLTPSNSPASYTGAECCKNVTMCQLTRAMFQPGDNMTWLWVLLATTLWPIKRPKYYSLWHNLYYSLMHQFWPNWWQTTAYRRKPTLKFKFAALLELFNVSSNAHVRQRWDFNHVISKFSQSLQSQWIPGFSIYYFKICLKVW